MSHLTLNTAPSGQLALLVKLEWGVSNVARYTTHDSDVTIAGDAYTSEVKMEVTAAEQDGSLGDKPWMLRVPQALVPFDKMVRGCPHATVTVTIYSADPTVADGSQMQVEWAGTITKTTSTAAGVAGVVDCEVSGWRSNIVYPIGIQADERCSNIFGRSPCCFDLSTQRQTATISAVSGFTVTAATVTTPGGITEWWASGSINVDGLIIQIIGRSGSVFTLKSPVPPEWNGATAIFTPGCLMRRIDCRDRNNETNFVGLGIGITPYDPRADDPG